MSHSELPLALLGARPAFTRPRHVGAPNLGSRSRLLARIERILDSRLFTNRGPMVEEFEQRVAEISGVRHCIAMCNGTAALEITTRALDFTGEAIVPSMTFVATAHALQWQRVRPVFADIVAGGYHLDPMRIAGHIGEGTRGIVPVNIWGQVCDIEGIQAVADAHGLPVVFDSSHVFGCSHGGRMVGGFGNAEVFSFHATKFVNTFEGGAVVTNDDALAERIRLMQNFGFEGRDRVEHVGINGKMSEIGAAMGLVSLESMPEFIRHNRANYEAYREGLSGIPGIHLMCYKPDEHCNYQYIVIEVEKKSAGLSRDQLLDVLQAENIDARRYFWPGCHRMEPYRSLYPGAGKNLPNTEALLERVITLPTGTAVSPEDVAAIIRIIRIAVQESERLAVYFSCGQSDIRVAVC
ncbi:MAG TPA: dTDP-4-dehydro-6-deoxyglucose aminotransferase [Gammaproteobacteria bacterium]|nr:dTDP-4-dehydro-6-deoxyglucose aminotransferase [Gammaproteobacteria bacterium]